LQDSQGDKIKFTHKNKSIEEYDNYLELCTNKSMNTNENVCLEVKAFVLNMQGHKCEAINEYTNLLKKVIREIGNNNNQTLEIMENIGKIFLEQEKFEEALEFINKVIKGKLNLFAADDETTLKSIYIRAAVLSAMRKCDSNYDKIKLKLENQISTLGITHPDTLITLTCKATFLNDAGRYTSALPIFQQIVDQYEKMYGKDNNITINILLQKAVVLSSLEKLNESLSIFEQVLKVKNNLQGADNIDTVNTMYLKVKTFLAADMYIKAIALLSDIIERRIRLLGKYHKDTIKAMLSKANALQTVNKYDEAFNLYGEAYKIQIQVYGIDREESMETMYNQAFLLWKMGKMDEALNMTNKLIEISVRVFGEKHEITIDTLSLQSIILKKQN
jgi:tetratricopeptide (TPR) repeat protein